MEDLNILQSKSIKPEDITNHYKKLLVSRYSEQRILNPNKKVTQISDDLDVSLSTINRYKRDIGFAPVKRHKMTTEQKRDMTLKIAQTKARNSAFNEEVEQLNQSNLPLDQVIARTEEIRQKYGIKNITVEDDANDSADVTEADSATPIIQMTSAKRTRTSGRAYGERSSPSSGRLSSGRLSSGRPSSKILRGSTYLSGGSVFGMPSTNNTSFSGNNHAHFMPSEYNTQQVPGTQVPTKIETPAMETPEMQSTYVPSSSEMNMEKLNQMLGLKEDN